MKRAIYFLFPVTLAALLGSCAPVYRCGEQRLPSPPITWSKNLKNVVRERDYLCLETETLKKENAVLQSNITEMTNQIKELTVKNNDLSGRNGELMGKYNNLIKENLSNTEVLNKALLAKSDELNAKEKLLSEREKTLKEMQTIVARQDSITKSLNAILRNALLGFNPDELSVEIINGKVYVSMTDKLLFSSGSAAVEEKGKQALKLLAGVLDKNSEIDILVEGHTDNVPIKTAVYKDNWDLSVARATSIVRILTSDYRISPVRLTASGKGEYSPKAGNSTPEGRARNRRTEIILSPKLGKIMQLLNS